MGWLAIACACVVAGCGSKSNSSATDATPATADGRSCGVGDACNVSANTGCNDDDRCAVIELGACFFPACEGTGPEQLGDPCSMSDNNEGAETWDGCAPTLVCFQSVCTQACGKGGATCTAPKQCLQDPDIGTLDVDLCM